MGRGTLNRMSNFGVPLAMDVRMVVRRWAQGSDRWARWGQGLLWATSRVRGDVNFFKFMSAPSTDSLFTGGHGLDWSGVEGLA